MAKQTSTGITLGVVDETPATNDAAGFGALTFEEVGEVIDIPEYGPNVQVVESQPLATGVTEKFNGFRSEEHTSELQSRGHLVCRLLLEKKKNTCRRIT